MSYERALDAESLRQLLDEVYQDLLPINKALSCNDLAFSEEDEKDRWYKAIDSHGNIYLARNPALMVAQGKRGALTVYRDKPKKMLTAKEARSGEFKSYYAGAMALGGSKGEGVQL